MNQSIKKIDLRSALYQRRFIFPNLFTVGNLFCGFLAIVYASNGQFDKSVFAVFAGIMLDSLDGRVARKLNAESSFGVQFDSLADLLTFGVAPAFLSYQWYFKQHADEFGVLVCFVYLLCEAARLAKFNVSKEDPNASTNFSGLPSPAAAALVVSTINLFPDLNAPEISIILATLYLVTISGLMVSNLVYQSGKKIKFSNPLQITIIFGLTVAFLWYAPRMTFFVLAVLYCASGPLLKFRYTNKLLKRVGLG